VSNIAELIARCAQQGRTVFGRLLAYTVCTQTRSVLTCLCIMRERDSEKGNNKTTGHLLRYFFFSDSESAFAQPLRELRRYRDRVTRFIARTRGQRRTLSLITVDVQEERNNLPVRKRVSPPARARAQAYAIHRRDTRRLAASSRRAIKPITRMNRINADSRTRLTFNSLCAKF